MLMSEYDSQRDCATCKLCDMYVVVHFIRSLCFELYKLQACIPAQQQLNK